MATETPASEITITEPKPTASAPVAEVVTPSVTSLAPVAASPTALAIPTLDPAMQKKLAKLPESTVEKFKRMPKPAWEELQNALATLPLERREAVQTLLEKANPYKEGVESGSSNSGFKARLIKIEQGIGVDPVKPEGIQKGQMYDSQGYILAPKSRLVLLLITKNRALWAPKDSEASSNRPLCSSPDARMGTEYGECAKCSFASKKTTEGGCGRGITAYFMNEEGDTIYRVIFSKTSYPAGETFYKMATEDVKLWEHFWTLETVPQSGGTGNKKNTWFIFGVKRSNLIGDEAKKNKTTPEMKPVYSLFSRWLWHEVFLAEMLFTYNREKGQGHGAPSVAVEEDVISKMTDAKGNPIGKVENPDFNGDV